MMKILTQKMLGAQGLEAGCQDFVISGEAEVVFVFQLERQ